MLLSRKIGILAITLLVCTSAVFAANESVSKEDKKDSNQCTQKWLTNNLLDYQKAIDSLEIFNTEKERLQTQLKTCKSQQCKTIKEQIKKIDQDFNAAAERMRKYKQCSDRLTILEKPVITGPTSVTVDDNNLYSVIAKSSNNTLQYSIKYTFDWGDGSPKESKAIESGYSAYHTYKKSGTYTITATARDSLGKTTKNTLAITATDVDDMLCVLDPSFCLKPYWYISDGICQEDGFKMQTVACYEKGVSVAESKCNPKTKPTPQKLPCPSMSNFSITSPNGGETWLTGNTQNITWSYDGFAGNQEIELYLNFPTGPTCFLGTSLIKAKSFAFMLQKNFQCPNISQTITDGSYKVVVFPKSGDFPLDHSDNDFTIVNNTNISQQITVSVDSTQEYDVATNGPINIPFSWTATRNSSLYAYLLNTQQDPSNPEGGAYSSVSLSTISGSTQFVNQLRPITTGMYRVVVCDQSTDILLPNCVKSPAFAIFRDGLRASFDPAASTPTQFLVVGHDGVGLTDGSKNVFRITANNGPITITDLKFTVTGIHTVSTLRIDNLSNSLSSVGYSIGYNIGTANITNLSLLVPTGGNGILVNVLASYNSVSPESFPSLSGSVITLTSIKYISADGTTNTYYVTPSTNYSNMMILIDS